MTQAERVRHQLTDYAHRRVCTEMVRQQYLFSHATKLSFSAFNAAGGG